MFFLCILPYLPRLVSERMDDADGALSNEEKVTHLDNGEESKDKEVESEEMRIHKVLVTFFLTFFNVLRLKKRG